jgi:peptidoglycan-associated lipoprotein
MKTSLILSALCLVVVLAGCPAKKPATETSAPETAPVTDVDINGGNADSDSGKAMGLETVRYAYDSSSLDSSAKATLDNNARILKEKANLRVQIEGHTDERGGIQYNIALGERRANAAKSYLQGKGISADRLSTISYGKEKPVDGGHDEGAWAKNRRANFRVTEK